MIQQIKLGTYADVRYDFAFKKCFGTEENKDATIALLNSILPDLGIVDVKFENTELQGLSEVNRKGVIDILCTTAKGETFIIEMQNAVHKHFQARTYLYSSLYVLKQTEAGAEWDFNLKSTYVVSFLNFEMKFNDDGYVHRFITAEQPAGEKLEGSTEFFFIDLPAFGKKEDELSTELEKWIYLLKNSKEMSKLPESCAGKGFTAFDKAAKIANFSTDERIIYEKNMITEWDIKMCLKEAREDGIEQGMAEGIERGKVEGRTEGMAEKQKEIAKAMLAQGIDFAIVSTCTGLSAEELKELGTAQ